MASGIKRGGNRPKSAKHLRSATQKRFRNEDPASKAKYAEKLAMRAARKRTRKNKR